jgi:hypothetical protein
VTNNLDALATALYVKVDDLLKGSPELAPWRPAVCIAPKLTDAELVTMAVMQALCGFTSESRWLRFACAHLGRLFRYLLQQSGYNKRLRNAATLITTVIRVLSADTTLWTGDVWVVDSTPVECGRSRTDGPSTAAAPAIPATFGACACNWRERSVVSRSGSR